MKLNEISKNKNAIIVKINTDENTLTRLNDLGVATSCKIKVVRKALFSSPIEIQVKNYRLALRKSLAKQIEVIYE